MDRGKLLPGTQIVYIEAQASLHTWRGYHSAKLAYKTLKIAISMKVKRILLGSRKVPVDPWWGQS